MSGENFISNIGQTKEMINNAGNSNNILIPRVKLKEGTNIHRPINGPVLSRTVFWRTEIEDPETKKPVSTVKVALANPGSILDKVASVEYRIRVETGETKPQLVFKPKEKYSYTIFDYNKQDRIVEVADYPATIKDKLVDLQNKFTKNGDKLKYGLLFMYPVIITKHIDPTKNAIYGTKYETEVDIESPQAQYWAGKVPISYLKFDKDMINEKFSGHWDKIFNEEEIEALCTKNINLTDILKPMSDEEILEKFAKFPIDLYAEDRNGRRFFAEPEQFAKKLEEYEIKFLERKTNVANKSTNLLNGRKQSAEGNIPANEVKVSLKDDSFLKEDNESDANFEDLPDITSVDDLFLKEDNTEDDMEEKVFQDDLSFLK